MFASGPSQRSSARLDAIGTWRGQQVRDADDQRLGKLEEVYFDPRTGRPAYACVKAGLLGRRLSFVSLSGATLGEGYVRLGQTRAQVKDAPALRAELRLTSGQAHRLSEHYAATVSPSARPRVAVSSSPVPRPAPAAVDAAGAELLERLDSLERRVRELQRTLG